MLSVDTLIILTTCDEIYPMGSTILFNNEAKMESSCLFLSDPFLSCVRSLMKIDETPRVRVNLLVKHSGATNTVLPTKNFKELLLLSQCSWVCF